MAKSTKTQRRNKVSDQSSRPTAKPPAYLKKLSTAVRGLFADAVDLPTFLATAGALTPEHRKLLVRQALVLIEQNYVHLPLKRAMHAIDPVQRLKLILQELELTPPAALPAETTFHREMTEIFTSTRDLHTNYLLPAPFNGMTAFLPFMVEDYIQGGQRKYLVSHVAQGFSHPTFVKGVELVSWNGIPIERAVLNNAQRYAGSNREAQHARGVSTLTTRVLRIALPPDEGWVVVGYQTTTGEFAETRIDWMVNPPLPSGEAGTGDAADDPEVAYAIGLDLEQHLVQQMRKALFAPQAVAAEKKVAEKGGARGGLGRAREHHAERIRGPFRHHPRRHLRLPPHPDVRGPGRRVYRGVHPTRQRPAAERPHHRRPRERRRDHHERRVHSPGTHPPANRTRAGPVHQHPPKPADMPAERGEFPGGDLSTWVGSMQQALQTGAVFSAGFPISDPEQCNAIGQKYFGPVVLVIDALCYSTTDFFAAGFQDHEIGPVLGADGNTGAGGANVWTHDCSASCFPGPGRSTSRCRAGPGCGCRCGGACGSAAGPGCRWRTSVSFRTSGTS